MLNKNLKLEIFFLAILFCGFFGLVKNSQAATYYFRTDGEAVNLNDAVGPTTNQIACGNLSKIEAWDNLLSDGDTIILSDRGGDYVRDVKIEIADKKLDINADGTPTFNNANTGMYGVVIWVHMTGASQVTIKGITINNPVGVNNSGISIQDADSADSVGRVENCTINNVLNNAVGLVGLKGGDSGDESTWSWVKNTQITTAPNGGIYVNDSNNVIYEYNIIDGNQIDGSDSFGNDGISIHDGLCDNHIIRYNTIRDFAENCVDNPSAPKTNNIWIYGNDLSQAGQYVIGSAANNVYTYGNKIHDTPGPIILASVDNNIYFHNNVVYNWPVATAYQAIDKTYLLCDDSDPDFTGRIFFDNNTVVVNVETNRNLVAISSPNAEWLEFRNNLIYNFSSNRLILFRDTNFSAKSLFSNNFYYFINDWNDGRFWHDYVSLFTSSQVQILGQELNSYAVKASEHPELDPSFVNDSGNYSAVDDFQLNSDSPLINAGTDVGLTEDFDGNPLVGTPDIGAYEYQGDITPPVAPGGLRVD